MYVYIGELVEVEVLGNGGANVGPSIKSSCRLIFGMFLCDSFLVKGWAEWGGWVRGSEGW